MEEAGFKISYFASELNEALIKKNNQYVQQSFESLSPATGHFYWAAIWTAL